jgi:hemerythrin-like domain-containing protein
MPEFRTAPSSSKKKGPGQAGEGAAELLRQHKEIHKGMDQFEEYLNQCRSGERELVLAELKERMDSWGEVLWKHLDQEVKTLGAENMRRYWTVQEMKRMPM